VRLFKDSFKTSRVRILREYTGLEQGLDAEVEIANITPISSSICLRMATRPRSSVLAVPSLLIVDDESGSYECLFNSIAQNCVWMSPRPKIFARLLAT